MAIYGTWWIIYKIVFPLIIGFLILANLPAILSAIFGLAFLVVSFPFLVAYFIFEDWYKGRRKKESNSNSSQQQYKTEEEYQPPPNKHAELYRLLGVRFNATKAEIRSAFKNKMMMNHPDKLANLDPELQKIAQERTIAIKDAYDRLTS